MAHPRPDSLTPDAVAADFLAVGCGGGPAVCLLRCFAGSADRIEYGERWGGVTVDIVGPFEARRAELAERGWTVEVLDGLDHLTAMQAKAVLPVLRPWLERLY